MKILSLPLLLFVTSVALGSPTFEGASEGKIINGSNCRIEVKPKAEVAGKRYLKVSVEFERSADEGFFVDASMDPISESEFQGFFVNNLNGEITDYPYDLIGEAEDHRYELTYDAMKLLNRHRDSFLHENLILHFNREGHLLSMEANYEERWPFPANFSRNEEISKICTF